MSINTALRGVVDLKTTAGHLLELWIEQLETGDPESEHLIVHGNNVWNFLAHCLSDTTLKRFAQLHNTSGDFVFNTDCNMPACWGGVKGFAQIALGKLVFACEVSWIVRDENNNQIDMLEEFKIALETVAYGWYIESLFGEYGDYEEDLNMVTKDVHGSAKGSGYDIALQVYALGN